MDREKVIKELHDARRYLEDKEWSDRGASPHIDAINDVLALLKEQEAVKPTWFQGNPFCGKCGQRPEKKNRNLNWCECPKCKAKVKLE